MIHGPDPNPDPDPRPDGTAYADAARIARETVEEVLRQNPSASVAEINAALSRRTAGYNRTPQADLGGLSPEQVARLIYDDWLTEVRLLRPLEAFALAECRPEPGATSPWPKQEYRATPLLGRFLTFALD